MFKRLLDVVLSVFVLLLTAPVLLMIAILVKLDSEGPVFFVQERLGLNGKVFKMFKFRTMVVNAERMGTGLFSYENDPRITKVGRILRATSLDEIPQIFNVLCGSMSLVGPRPPVTYELGSYSDFTPNMKIRFQVKPGITGLAQVSGRNDLDWDHKIEFDNRYVVLFARFGVLVDLAILLRTVFVVLSMSKVVEKERGGK